MQIWKPQGVFAAANHAASEDDKYVFEQDLEAIESDPDGKLQEMRIAQLEAVKPMPVEDDGERFWHYPYN